MACLAAAGLLLVTPRSGPAQEGELAAAVKATYLYKFAPFVQWPNPTAEFPGDVFPICVAGASTVFADLLQAAVGGQAVTGHRVIVRVLSTISPNPACAVMYLAGPQPQSVVGMLNAVHNSPVLTVTDEATDAKGIINFVTRDNRVRFEIDDAAATAAGLVISSKLLALAVSVHAAGH